MTGELLPLVFTSGWASGVNAYATVLLLGLLGRFAGVDAVPAGLERTDVLVAAAVLYAVEFVADKIPYVDSTWDAVHTAIRPTVGAVIGLLVAGDADSLETAVLSATGGVTADARFGRRHRELDVGREDDPDWIAVVLVDLHENVVDQQQPVVTERPGRQRERVEALLVHEVVAAAVGVKE